MDKKVIQEQRMRTYFVEATKEILKGEGFKAISVRNIADKAGYSYATLYNYFKDLRELIFVCVEEFQDDCRLYVQDQIGESAPGINRIKAITKAYAAYFVEYPGVFDLFFLEKANGIELDQDVCRSIHAFPRQLCQVDWSYCIQHGYCTEQQSRAFQDEMNYIVTGLLLFYLNRCVPSDYNAFTRILDTQVEQCYKLEVRTRDHQPYTSS